MLNWKKVKANIKITVDWVLGIKLTLLFSFTKFVIGKSRQNYNIKYIILEIYK